MRMLFLLCVVGCGDAKIVCRCFFAVHHRVRITRVDTSQEQCNDIFDVIITYASSCTCVKQLFSRILSSSSVDE